MTTDGLLRTASVDELTARQQMLRARAALSGVDAVVISTGADMRYLLGRSQGSHERLTALVVPTKGSAFLIVPELERPGWEGSSAESMGLEMSTWPDGDSPYRLLAARLGPIAELAVDDVMPVRHAHEIRTAVDCRVEPAGELIGGMRVVKTDEEIMALTAVAAAIDRVHRRVHEWLRPGRTERQVGADIAAAIVAEGHQRPDFVIVGSGPNGASPHLEQTDRVIGAGDPVVVDIGGPAPSGYFSDSTRTYCVGSPGDPEFATVHDIVRTAQQKAFETARAGVSAAAVDQAARTVIEQAGYGPYFITRTGHGIGLEVHEEPYIVRGDDRLLSPGMAFSIEPGIYLPGRFGVRIEDIVLIGADGSPVRLNHSPTRWELP